MDGQPDHMLRLNVRQFVEREFGGVRALHERLSPLGDDRPSIAALWKWVGRNSMPLDWFLVLVVLSGKADDVFWLDYCEGIGECTRRLRPGFDTTGESFDVFG